MQSVCADSPPGGQGSEGVRSALSFLGERGSAGILFTLIAF